ncbi:hypothetical protein D1Y84_03840 [Acidipila sp. EB88]|nr:hypothetical protein D1Y84_03840 [Acidipila sp. EB88]
MSRIATICICCEPEIQCIGELSRRGVPLTRTNSQSISKTAVRSRATVVSMVTLMMMAMGAISEL